MRVAACAGPHGAAPTARSFERRAKRAGMISASAAEARGRARAIPPRRRRRARQARLHSSRRAADCSAGQCQRRATDEVVALRVLPVGRRVCRRRCVRHGRGVVRHRRVVVLAAERHRRHTPHPAREHPARRDGEQCERSEDRRGAAKVARHEHHEQKAYTPHPYTQECRRRGWRMTRAGLEPATYRLKVRCSAS